MPSPFPGMNPYLEQKAVWPDFHQAFIAAARETLAPQLSPAHIVRIDIQLYVHELPEGPPRPVSRGEPSGIPREGAGEPSSAGGAVAVAPAEVRLPVADIERVSYLEIRDRLSRQVVTVIELLSPSNKYAGPDREQYLVKRGRLLQSPSHFVEIDLLRGGPRMPMEVLPVCDYYALVSRAPARPRAEVWPVRLTQPLPPIPIPLSEPHPDAYLELQAVLHHVYDAARYEDDIYTGEPEPALSAVDAAWARQFLPGR